jgi:hypothetical protein
MAGDDDRGAAPDPWDDIVAEGLGEEAGEIAFRFEEPDVEPVAPENAGDETTAQESAGTDAPVEEPLAAGDGDAADALVEDWLSEGDGMADPAVPPLSVFAPEDAAAGSSSIEIGTGASAIGLHGEPQQEEIGDPFAEISGSGAGEAAAEWPGIDAAADAATAAEPDEGGFPLVETTGAAAVVAASTAGGVKKPVKRPAKPAKKAGGIGQLVGIMLGGVMAIPITLGILLYGLGKDPFGVAKAVPPQAAFLLPQKFRPGYKRPAPARSDVAGGSALDNLPTIEPVEPEPPAPESVEPSVDEPPAVEPSAVVDSDAVVPPPPDTVSEPAPEPLLDTVAVDGPGVETPGFEPPGLDGLGVEPEPAAPAQPPAPPEPPPLDTLALDEAVGDAAALCAALGAVDDKENRAYKLLRTRWYRALARVAEELVAVENAAAITGRPLASPPDNVAALHGQLGGRASLAAELAALAPDWLAYEKRGSDGVVVPVNFGSSRRVGPYWSSRVTLTAADGTSRDLTVVSRAEPAAIAGDRLVVTGVALDGAVIWAADVRPAADGGDLSAGF